MKVTVSLRGNLVEKVDGRASDIGLSRSAIITIALYEYFFNKDKGGDSGDTVKENE